MSEDLEKKIKKLEREVRVLTKKLGRAEENQAIMEETKDRFDAMYQNVLAERHAAEEKLTEAYNVITSSITYASRIQRSILPDAGFIEAVLTDHFIFWEPRDVVGGDIYWAGAWGEGFLVMLGDCTGHGVPGAFMTLISMGSLERAMHDVPSGDVGALIQRMHQYIQITLRQQSTGGESDDGIEMGACYFVPDDDELLFAGARFELFIVDGDEVETIKGTKSGLGYRSIAYDQVFDNKPIPLHPGQSFYMTSDGLIDQVGGERNRSFGKRRFRNLLVEIQDLSFADQMARIEAALHAHQGSQPRRDDVAVIGFKV